MLLSFGDRHSLLDKIGCLHGTNCYSLRQSEYPPRRPNSEKKEHF